MRPYLLDFLIEAHAAFRLLPDTLYLTVNLLDRYCSKRIVYKRHYQLVGCAALLIAAKYGDRKERVPTIRELKGMCCSLYDEEMFTQMEWHVLQTLGWVIGHPTVDSFLQFALEGGHLDLEVEHMARYISEIAMFHKDLVSKPPSDIARSSLALARCVFNLPQPLHGGWATMYNPHTLLILSQNLHGPSQVLSRKYSTGLYSQASLLLEEFLARTASIAKFYAFPPSPPSEVPFATAGKSPSLPGVQGPYATPSKAPHVPFNFDDCLTPPITPDAPGFAGYKPHMANPCRPPTPGTMGAQPPPQRFWSQYTLPPIDQVVPM